MRAMSPTGGLMSAAGSIPSIAIACQGGGSHAAFGAGVMHRLLEDDGQKFRLGALSGTSGGAVNAVLAWSGLIQGGKEGGQVEAQRRLHGLWEDLGASEWPDMIRNWWGQFFLTCPSSAGRSAPMSGTSEPARRWSAI